DAKEGRVVRRLLLPEAESVLGFPWATAFSPDGRLVGAATWKLLAGRPSHYKAYAWDVASGQVHRTLELPTLAIRGIAFSPDGRPLAVNGGHGAALVWDLDGDREEIRVASTYQANLDTFLYSNMAFSPDGAALALSPGDGTVQLLDLKSRERRDLHKP